MLDRAKKIERQLIDIRREIHAHPELGFREFKTSQKVSDVLTSLGIEHQRGIAKTGIVATLGDGSGPVVALRADMDALPIQEANDVSYRSQTDGLMHACGHDAHTAGLLGAAMLLSQEKIHGTVRLIFQPSEEMQDEEAKSGGMRMVEEGALNGVEAVFGLHVASDAPSGYMEIGDGPIMAAVDSFEGRVIGRGCHGAYPHRGLDPVWLSAQVINAIHGIVPRRKDPTLPGLISACTIHGGTANNVIPDDVTLTGTIRSFDPAVRQLLHDELRRAFEVAKAMGGDCEFKLLYGYPTTVNDPTKASFMRDVAGRLFGADAVNAKPALHMGAEDFSFMAQKTPGAFVFMGAAKGDRARPHHNQYFDIDESVIAKSAALLAETAKRYLAR
ncbi:MAG: amidohydrolase [Chloroflexi bacterium]|nr:amidohydrolase [Chloroflexota bacterium]